MKKSTKLFSLFMSFVMVFSLLGSVSASASYLNMEWPSTSDELNHMTVVGDKLVSYTGTNSQSVVIPMEVVAIADGVFKNHTELKQVTGEGIERVGNSAFEGCTNIEDAFLGNLNYIGNNAFKDCPRLITFGAGSRSDLPAGNLTIGKAAFKNDVNLRAFYSRGTIPNLQAETFANCNKLEIVGLDTITNPIDPNAFNAIEANGAITARTSNPVIYCKQNSQAQIFAKKYGMKFSTEATAVYAKNPYELTDAIPAIYQNSSVDNHYIPAINVYKMYGEFFYNLRDLADVAKKYDFMKFGIQYNATTNTIDISKGGTYVPNGKEHVRLGRWDYVPYENTTKMEITINGQSTGYYAYSINGKAHIPYPAVVKMVDCPTECSPENGGIGFWSSYEKYNKYLEDYARYNP